MPADMPPAPPEAEVIRLGRNATGISAQKAAEATKARKTHGGRGVSATYWRDVERGYGGRRGERVPVKASDQTLASMAHVVRVTPLQLTRTGREGAAKILEEILRRERESIHDLMVRVLTDPLERFIWDTTTLTEDERLSEINTLRAKRAELAAEKVRDDRRASS
jgi:hypothetical protein